MNEVYSILELQNLNIFLVALIYPRHPPGAICFFFLNHIDPPSSPKSLWGTYMYNSEMQINQMIMFWRLPLKKKFVCCMYFLWTIFLPSSDCKHAISCNCRSPVVAFFSSKQLQCIVEFPAWPSEIFFSIPVIKFFWTWDYWLALLVWAPLKEFIYWFCQRTASL